MKFKNKKLINLFLILANTLLAIFIIKEFKVLDFCHTILTLISPLFWGYAIAWLVKPVMLYFNKYFKTLLSTIMTYALLAIIIGVVSYLSIPVIIHEVKTLIPQIINMYENLDPRILNRIDLSMIGTKILEVLNKYTNNLKDILATIFYSLFISFFFLTNHESVSRFFAKRVPPKLIYRLSINLKAFVRGTLLDTIILLFLCLISFWIAKLPYALLFAVLISITNIIPYVGPYIGGIPSVIVAFNVSYKLGIAILIIIVVFQLIESSFIHPYIMSKSVKINPILIMISLIFFGYFFGIFGMVISTPIASIIKTLYLYNKEFKIINWPALGKSIYRNRDP